MQHLRLLGGGGIVACVWCGIMVEDGGGLAWHRTTLAHGAALAWAGRRLPCTMLTGVAACLRATRQHDISVLGIPLPLFLVGDFTSCGAVMVAGPGWTVHVRGNEVALRRLHGGNGSVVLSQVMSGVRAAVRWLLWAKASAGALPGGDGGGALGSRFLWPGEGKGVVIVEHPCSLCEVSRGKNLIHFGHAPAASP